MLKLNNLLIILCLLGLVSCIPQKDFVYFHNSDSDSAISTKVPEPVIQPNDLLSINVFNSNKEASALFNSISFPSNLDEKNGGTPVSQGYLVDVKGCIEMPIIGSVKAAGLTTRILKDTLQKKLDAFLENPTILINFLNYKVTVLGEVFRPGIVIVKNEKISLPEALGAVGDMTIFGKRKNVTVIREEDGKRIFGKVDLTSKKAFDSPFFWLKTNDIVYVEPGKGRRIASSEILIIMPIILSSLTLIGIISQRLK